MDKLRKLYDSYKEQGLISEETSFEQFSSADDTIKNNLYKSGVENKVISGLTDFDTFNSAWQLDEPEKVKTEAVATEAAPVAAEEAVAMPSRAEMISGVKPEDMVSTSEDTSLDAPETANDLNRYIEFKSGNVVYEDTYLQDKAGKEGYPSTFDEYAEAFGTTPKQFDTPEIEVEAISSFEKLPELKNAWRSKKYNPETKLFETNFNQELMGLDEEEAVEMFKNIYKGSGIDFEQADQILDTDMTELDGEVLFTDALKMKVLNKDTGEYIYSKPIELQKGDKLNDRNSSIINNFIEDNKEYLDIPGWTKEKTKQEVNYNIWKKDNFNPVLAKQEDQLSEEFLTNKDLFRSTKKYVNVKGVTQEDGTVVSGTSRVLKEIKPYKEDIDKEVYKILQKKTGQSKEEILDQAEKNVRQNLYESARNEAIYKLNEEYLSESDDQSFSYDNQKKSQGLLYVSLLNSKNKEAEKYNEHSKKFQIADEQLGESQKDKQVLIDLYSKQGGADAGVDQKKILKLFKKYGVDIAPKFDKTNDPDFNVKIGLTKKDEVPTNFYNIYKAITSSSEANIDVLNKQSDGMNSVISKMSDTGTALDAASKNYVLGEKYLTNVALGASDIVVGTGFLAANILSLGQSEKLKEAGVKYVEATNELRDSYVRDVTLDDAFSSSSNTGKFIAQEVSNQIPILVSMMATGGAAAYVVGASSAGKKAMDMQHEIATGRASYTQPELWLKSVGFGAAEGVFSALTTVKALARAKGAWLNAGKDQVVNNSMKQYFKSKSPDFIFEPIKEAAGEVATTGAQNLIDGKPFTENMDHSGLSGFGFGLLFAGIPFMKGMYNSQFSTYESRNEIRELNSRVDFFSKRLSNNMTGKDSNSYKETLKLFKGEKAKLDDLLSKQEDFVSNKLTEEGKNSFLKANYLKLSLQTQAENIQADPNLNSDEKTAAIKNLQESYKWVSENQNKALSNRSIVRNEVEWNSFKAAEKDKAEAYLNTANEMLSSDNEGKDPTLQDIEARAYNLYFADQVRESNSKVGRINSGVFKGFKSFETKQEAIDDVNSNINADSSVQEKAKAKRTIEGIKNGNDGYADPTTGKQVAIVESQVANKRKYTKTHEVGHEVFWELLGRQKNNKSFEGISNQILKTLKTVDDKLYNTFIKDGIDDDSGNVMPEEVISRFLEYVNEGKITNVEKAKGIAGLFGAMVQKEFKDDYNFDFRGKDDIFNFTVQLAKKIESGELTLKNVKDAKKSDLIKQAEKGATGVKIKAADLAFSKLSDLKAELQEMDEFDYDNEFEFEQAVSSLESRISRLEKSEKASSEKEMVTKPKNSEDKAKTKQLGDSINELIPTGTTKKQYDSKTIAKVSEKLVTGDMLDNLIKKIAAGYGVVSDNVFGKNWDYFYNKVKNVQFVKNLKKFNPEVNDDFGGYVIGSQFGIRNRVKEALEELKKENEGGFKEDVSTVKGVATEGTRDFDSYTSAEQGLPAGELIDVTSFRSVKDKVDAVRDVVNLEGVDVADLTYKKVVDDYAGPAGAEIIGLHDKNAQPEKGQDKNNFQKLAERIDGTRTLNYGKGINGEAEVRAMQKLFIDYNDMLKFIKTIPEFNVAPFETTIDKQGRSIDLTTDAKGYSVGTSNVLLIQLYDVYVDPKSKSTDKAIKGRSITSPSGRGKGKTSQVSKVYRLKDKYRGRIDRKAVKELQKIIGITEAGEAFIPMKGVNRTLFGTALQGLTKIYAANAANTIIRKDIVGKGITSDKKSTEKVLADIGGGKSSVMFSKTVDLLNNINKKPYKEFKGGLREKRAVMFDVVSDITIKKGVDAGSIALNELKKIRSVFKYEYVNAGFLNAMTDLKSKVKNSTPEESEQLVIDFLRFISRSARTSKGKNLQYVSTNKKMFNEAVASVLGEDNNFSLSQITIMEDGKPKDVNVIKFKGKRLRGFTDVTAIKKDRFSPIINEEADMARTVVLNKIDTLKHRLKTDPNFTKEMFDTQLESFLSLASLDQRGLIRKMSKTNAQVEGKFKATDLYLEHKMSALEITEKLKEYANGEISIEDLQKTLDEEALVNLMPKSLAKALPDFKAERSKNPSYKNSSGYKTKKYLNKLKELNLSIVDIDGNIETPAGDRVVFSKNLNETFNKIIENKKGILAGETFSEVKAKLMANSKRKFNIFVPPSAEDFVGLLYATLGKGKVGDKQMDFYKKALLKPYARAMEAIRRDRLDLGKAFKEIKKQFNTTPKDLKKKLPDSLFNREQAVRVFIWDSVGKEVPGLSKAETKELVDYVSNDPKLKEFAEQVTRLNPGSRYTSPSETWSTGNITTDLLETMNESRRAKHLGRWQQNVDAIFTKDNLNKLEAAYGTSYRKAMENILTRMKTGRNRTYGSDSQTSKWIDWVNGSVGAIMFFNARSSVLQTLSATNFINFGDNNIFAAGKAFANQKQYWSDFARLINSEFLLDRRDSLKINVNEADIAEAASKNGVRGAINYILKLGFTPTKFADSFAIAIGGSTFYRNRMNALIKKGMDPVAAEKVAMRDFIETAEESQQSSRPDKISQEQAGSLGRIVLAFANTPAQYTRIIKKAASDLKNRRGSDRENISKIVYYGMAQNLIFNTLQQALFAIAFGNEEEEEDLLDEKKLNVVNGMLDSFMRGAGVGGAVLSTIKNTGLRIYKESQKDRPKYENAATEVLKISPPISSKFGKVVSAGKTLSWDMKEIKEKGFDITSPAVKAGAQVITAGTNLPLDRVVKKVENLAAASNEELETYKRIALALGWSKWELGIKDPKKKKTKKKGRNTTTRRTVTRKTIIR